MAEMNPDTIPPPSQPEYSLTDAALRLEQIEERGVGTAPSPADGMQRYPTEPPAPRARSARAISSKRWRALAGLVGAAGTLFWMSRGRCHRRSS